MAARRHPAAQAQAEQLELENGELKAQVKKGAFKQPSNEGLEALSQLTGSRPPSERRLKRTLDGNGNPTRRSMDEVAQ